MGVEVTATCDCGLNTTIKVGSGLLDVATTCLFPCLCEQCQDVVEVNLLADVMECPQCDSPNVVPYDDPSLSDGKGANTEASWRISEQLGRDLVLTDTKYRCPQCDEMTLRFIDSGVCWD